MYKYLSITVCVCSHADIFKYDIMYWYKKQLGDEILVQLCLRKSLPKNSRPAGSQQ